MLKYRDLYKYAVRRIILNNNKKKSCLLNIIFIVALSLVYCVSDGILQFAAGIMTSVLIGFSVTKYHYSFVAAGCAASVAVLTAFYSYFGGAVGAIAGIASGAILVLLGIGLGLSSNLKMSISGTVLMCSLIYLANMLIGFIVLGQGIPFETMIKEFREVLLETIRMQYANIPEINAAADEIIGSVMEVSIKFIPCLLICSAGVSGLILSFVYNVMIKKLNKNVKTESFSALHVERTVGVLFLAICLASSLTTNALIADALLNLILIICFAFFVCGLSYLDFSMKRKGRNKTYRTMMIFVVIPLVSMSFALPAVFIAGMGFFDSLINFRKRYSLKEDEDGTE